MPNRRELMAAVAGLGVGSTTFQRALAMRAQDESKKPKPAVTLPTSNNN